MRKIVLYSLFIALLTIPTTAFATSWAYIFVVWDGHTYEVTNDKVSAVGEQIGMVTSYSDMWPQSGNFSNHYPKGTKYFEIEGIEPSDAIAVEVGDGHYKKAENRGRYEKSPVTDQERNDLPLVEAQDSGLNEESSTFAQIKWSYFGVVFLILFVFVLFKMKK
ncbi:MAG: hypothetical protein ABS949_10315 [Solibacillus sp.]